MFTGIITDVGIIDSLEQRASGVTGKISTKLPLSSLSLGASVACAGACMTVIDSGSEGEGENWFIYEASVETLDCTTMGSWQAGDRVNLEGSLRLGDELGGHLVTGHVDGRAELIDLIDEADMRRLRFRAPPELARFIAAKGSVTLDGTSLTVNLVDGNTFTVMLIPHTLAVTTWSDRRPGDMVNIEVDLMARYVARLAE